MDEGDDDLLIELRSAFYSSYLGRDVEYVHGQTIQVAYVPV